MSAALQSVESPAFDLEADPPPGHVPERVVEELRQLLGFQRDALAASNEAIRAQAEKHHVSAWALRHYVKALVLQNTATVHREAQQLMHMIEGPGL